MIRSFVAGLGWGGVIAAMGLGVVSQVAPMPEGDIWAEAARPAEAVSRLPVIKRDVPAAEPEAAAPEAAVAEAALPEAAPEATPPEVALPPEPPEFVVEIVVPRAGDGAEAAPAGPKLLAPPAPAPLSGAGLAPPAPDAPVEIAAPPAQAVRRPPGLAEAPARAALAPPAALDLALAAPDPAPALAPGPPRLPAAPGPEARPPRADPPPPPPLPEVVTLPPARLPAGSPETFLPAPPLGEPVEGVVVGRLPRIGAPPEALPEAQPEAPPLTRYARAFDNPGALPLFSILLQDTGASDLDRARLAALPFPVSFVIDPMQPGAAAAAAIYRSAGQEVLMLASGIPAGATAADLEQTFQAHAQVLGEAVAVIDLPEGGFQNNRSEAAQVVPIVQAQGRGVVTYAQGLNAAAQVAARDGVPSAEIFRNLDAEEEAAPVIRRYLDRAAFKAAQEGRVVVIGRTRPATIAALADWAQGGRSRMVALAPVSAAMAEGGR